MNILIYIIKTIFISGALLSYYWLFLRNRPFHGFNRFFLMSIPLLSIVIPALHINPSVLWNGSGTGSPIRLLGVARGTWEETVTIYGSHKKGMVFTWTSVAVWISIIISICLLSGFIKSLRFLHGLKKQNPFLRLPEATLYFVSEKGTPFSFFRSIFWGRDLELNSEEGKQILRHELFHVSQQHSLDILLMELCTILMWFNPFLHIIRFELKAIHEYSADAFVIADTDEYAYAKLLLLNISGASVSLVHPFFKNQIKRRIAMITKTNKNKKALLGRFMILPLLLIFICLFSFKLQNNRSALSPATLSPAILRVVIDPGHGGVFNGTTFNGIYEKNINLSIAKKIQLLSKDYHVEVIMTREKDEDIAGNNLDASLKYRSALASSKNADLFISIHVNGTGKPGPQDQYSGFEIYVPASVNKFHTGSMLLGSSITEYIKPDYAIASELKERVHGIQVLDKATVPAILIECGYIDNKSDLFWLQDEKNQEKIARDILEGIQKYSQHATADAGAPHENITVTNNLSVTNNLDVNENNTLTDNHAISENTVDEKNLQLNQELQVNAHDSSSPSRKVEVEAEFPGGSNAWVQYLIKKSVYPPAAEKSEIQGDVQVEFVVNTNGKVSGVRAISGPEVFRAESVRLIKESGKWIPAMDKGRKVASYKIQPINYRLQEH
jgi:N-acetylmuramoyl-L-alanine amidase